MATVTRAAASVTNLTAAPAQWTNPSNAYATTGDAVYATGAPAKNSTVANEFWPANFTSADIPDGATINSVTISIKWKLSAVVTGGLLTIQAITSGGSIDSSTTKSTTAEETTTRPFLTVPTLAQLRAASTNVGAFVGVDKGNTSTAMTASLDYISFTVDYTLAATATPPHPTVVLQAVNRASSW